tara:strand:+ start:452 stop:658 length:207 start_codon:yes stop_codon:yes gene_type:complete
MPIDLAAASYRDIQYEVQKMMDAQATIVSEVTLVCLYAFNLMHAFGDHGYRYASPEIHAPIRRQHFFQ